MLSSERRTPLLEPPESYRALKNCANGVSSYAVGTKAAKAAQESTNDIPIIAATGDMVAAGLVKNVSQPEGNITGYSFF